MGLHGKGLARRDKSIRRLGCEEKAAVMLIPGRASGTFFLGGQLDRAGYKDAHALCV